MALGETIKHLVLRVYYPKDDHIQLEYPPLGPVYLDSFSSNVTFDLLDRFLATSRIQISRLRKVVVVASSVEDAATTQRLLRQCHETLEDFEFTPSRLSK